jgi:hypothetical protein
MPKLKLDEVIEELDKENYNINFKLLDGVSIVLKQESLDEIPTNNLNITNSELIYSIAMTTGNSLRDAYESWDRAYDKDRNVTLEDAQIEERKVYLRRLCEYLTPKIMNMVKSSLALAVNEDMNVIAKFDKDNESNEQKDYFYNVDMPLTRLGGKIANIISLGFFRRAILKEIDQYTERYLAWKVIEQTTDKMYSVLDDDAKCLHEEGELELSKQLKDIASFYGNISYYAGFSSKRMNKLLDRAFTEANIVIKFDTPNVDEISSKVYEKISNIHVNMPSLLSKLS